MTQSKPTSKGQQHNRAKARTGKIDKYLRQAQETMEARQRLIASLPSNQSVSLSTTAQKPGKKKPASQQIPGSDL